MTGFGRGVAACGARTLVVEVRAVNHRYLDIALRLPREFAGCEQRLRAAVRGRLRRGRVELVLAAGGPSAAQRALVVDSALAAQYHQALQELAAALELPLGLDAAALAGLPGVFESAERPGEPEAGWPAVQQAAEAALGQVQAMRAREGQVLARALGAALDDLQGHLQAVEARWPAAAAERQQALRARLRELLADAPADAGGAVAALLERADIREETVRVGSHLQQARACLDSPEPVGRRLDFLAQELHREWTTIAAKAVDAEIADRAVLARVAVEQVREQVGNVE